MLESDAAGAGRECLDAFIHVLYTICIHAYMSLVASLLMRIHAPYACLCVYIVEVTGLTP